MDRKFVIGTLCYVLLGIYMAASKDHGQCLTHAHIRLALLIRPGQAKPRPDQQKRRPEAPFC